MLNIVQVTQLKLFNSNRQLLSHKKQQFVKVIIYIKIVINDIAVVTGISKNCSKIDE